MTRRGIPAPEWWLNKGRNVAGLILTLGIRRGFRSFGSGSRITPPLRLWGASGISVGSATIIGDNCWLNCVPAAGGARESRIVIGDGVWMSGFCTIASAAHVEIGDHTILARGVLITDHAHARGPGGRVQRASTEGRPVLIGAGVWIGQGACVMPGVRIGDGAIVGANSVVTRDVPPGTVVVGSPARPVSSRRPAAGAASDGGSPAVSDQ
ncbi:acyltransferase [Pseudonocardia alni]|uniref:acyltransferase n=1 Tax=Pseudonocardia alni TaxID=33907 RepID=UPI0033EDB680